MGIIDTSTSIVNKINPFKKKQQTLLDTPANPSLKWYSYFLKFEGVLCITFAAPVYLGKFGFVWHDCGPPLSTDITVSSYLNMICTIYFVLGFYLFKASFDPEANKSLLGFATWGGLFAHAVVMIPAVFLDTTPVYSGPWIGSEYVGDIPPTMFGLTQYAHLFVDIPFLLMMWLINLIFAKKCFGSFLLL